MIDPRAYAMPEDRGPDSLEANVLRLMADLGLWGYHTHDSRRSEKGWPDWVILGPSGSLFRELKSERGTLSVEQRRVGSRLLRAGLDWSTWRPSDLFAGTIARQLRGIGASGNCPACRHLWSLHGVTGCTCKVYPAHSLGGEPCPCERYRP